MSVKIRVQIIGATGYAGGDLLRILVRHPHVELISLVAADVDKPTPVPKIWPGLRGVCEMEIVPAGAPIPENIDLVFMATPNTVAMKLAAGYLERGIRAIDFAGDFRLRDASVWEKWYGGSHTAKDLLAEAVYGMPELFREEIAMARLVANPGCFPTPAILGLYPAIREGLIDPATPIVSSCTGVTGAGKKPAPGFHFPEVDENCKAYRVGNHQHTPEIEEGLSRKLGNEVRVTFVPHLLPIRRGILSTIYCDRRTDTPLTEIQRIYEETYQNEPFVRVLPAGELPALHAVQLTNFVDVAVQEDKRTNRLIVLAAVDNTGKGASSQAVQNMNVMFGLPEITGIFPGPLTAP